MDGDSMKIIGLTGGVGSGKSTVGKIMQENFSLKLVMTDALGHLAMKVGTESYKKILSEFQADILQENGEIDRKKLGEIVFKDENKLDKLNQIIHPWVIEYLKKDIEEEKKRKQYQYYVMESAILFQSHLDCLCQEKWYVDAKEEIRRQRLKDSRGYSDEKIDNIFKTQEENEQYKLQCEVEISTNNGEQSILPQLEQFLV